MSAAFRVASLKHEAEVYRSQGLHLEALSICDKFMADNDDIQPALRSSLEGIMGFIRSDALDANPDEKKRLSKTDIDMIKKGWSNTASNKERLTSADIFMNLGFYEHALEEYRLLLENRCLTAAVFEGTALCLVHLTPPKHIALVVDFLAEELFKSPSSRRAFKHLIVNKMDTKNYFDHFRALSCHVAKESIYT